MSGNTLYGTAHKGGTFGFGTLFKLGTDGTGFTTLYTFTPFSSAEGPAGLILSGNTLYGTVEGQYTSESGTGPFKVNTDGTGFALLHTFTGGMDGSTPNGGLILWGDTLYGTAKLGGSSGNGTVFAVNTDGSGFRVLHSFLPSLGTLYGANTYGTNSDGARPYAGLVFSNNTLFGTAGSGGNWGAGTVFSIFVQPELTVTPAEENMVLMWPTNATGFILQSTTNLASPVWTTNLPAPVIVNGQYTVTNPISATQEFFRLSQ